MTKQERLNKIINIINDKKSVEISRLVELFDVSKMTINRDLTSLENKGFLRKVHGGAVKNILGTNVVPYPARIKKNLKEKQKISERAVKYIKKKGINFIGGGSTLTTFASIWPKGISFILLTNSVLIPIMVNDHENIEVHGTGGVLLKEYMTMVGPHAERIIENYIIDVAFICCFGMSSLLNIYEIDMYQASLLKKVSNVSKKVVLLMDHTKFGVETKYKSLDIEQVHVVITSKKAPELFIKNIIKKNIKVIAV